MKNHIISNTKKSPMIFLAGLLLLTASNAEAVSTFGGNATVNFTIDSITNRDGSANLEGLSVFASFVLDDSQTFNDFALNGNGSVTAKPLTPESSEMLSSGRRFSKTFQVDGAVSNGYGTVNYFALFDLLFINESGFDYDIGLTIDYSLSANAEGQAAVTTVSIAYEHVEGDFSGNDYANAWADLNSGVNQQLIEGKESFSFGLLAGDEEIVILDANILSYAQATAVPLPAALWLFASAVMALPVLKKRNYSAK
ncbi:hypothetical protein GO003_019270 [Methylicorpusculum oleiharenae]|uniref:hypothetical protein n=1 Tax=Methylicorpusculum oleiharenae TaxID=1338687 RepID=UPI001359AC78|nr:hypothetical protein [Methylicorpusculum oleiharenae]MCD2452530.1 hypothetical protein [Methylicorpusculum oleiharenae]